MKKINYSEIKENYEKIEEKVKNAIVLNYENNMNYNPDNQKKVIVENIDITPAIIEMNCVDSQTAEEIEENSIWLSGKIVSNNVDFNN
jgi:hypothetical protein